MRRIIFDGWKAGFFVKGQHRAAFNNSGRARAFGCGLAERETAAGAGGHPLRPRRLAARKTTGATLRRDGEHGVGWENESITDQPHGAASGASQITGAAAGNVTAPARRLEGVRPAPRHVKQTRGGGASR